MFMNLDTIPAGQAMYTLCLTMDPEGTARSVMSAEEVDLVAPARIEWGPLMNRPETQQVLKDLFGDDWIDSRLVGLVNQSNGYVVFDAFKAGIEEGADDL